MSLDTFLEPSLALSFISNSIPEPKLLDFGAGLFQSNSEISIISSINYS